MSLRYTPPPGGSGGVTPADNLWKYVGGSSPDNIELNQPAGVTGIFAPNPADAKMFLALFSYFGLPVSAFAFQNGAQGGLVGIDNVGGAYRLQLAMQDFITGENTYIYVDDTYQLNEGSNDGVDFHFRTTTKLSADENVGNIVSGDNVSTHLSKTSQATRVQVAGFDVLVYGGDKDGWIVTDGTNQRFRIKPNGNIQTDQTIAAGLKAPNGNYVEVFDMAGASQGFIQLTV
jgi:hypothetical protein